MFFILLFIYKADAELRSTISFFAPNILPFKIPFIISAFFLLSPPTKSSFLLSFKPNSIESISNSFIVLFLISAI